MTNTTTTHTAKFSNREVMNQVAKNFNNAKAAALKFTGTRMVSGVFYDRPAGICPNSKKSNS